MYTVPPFWQSLPYWGELPSPQAKILQDVCFFKGPFATPNNYIYYLTLNWFTCDSLTELSVKEKRLI